MKTPEYEAMIQKILHSINEGVILIDSNRTIIFINNTATSILGIPRERALGKDVVSTIPNTRLHIVLKTTVPEYDKLQYLDNTVIVTSRIPIFDEGANVIGVVAIFRDITSVQRLAEEVTNLKEIQTTLSAIIDSTHDAISVADERGKIQLVNKEYSRITGMTAEEVVGNLATIDIARGESIHLLVARTRQAVFGKRLVVGPARKEVIVDVTPLFVKGVFKGSVAVIHDLTETTMLMEQLHHVQQRLRTVQEQPTFHDIHGKSHKLRVAIQQAQRAAPTPFTILLRGERGTGKRLFAQAIHQLSGFHEGPFVFINGLQLSGRRDWAETIFGYESDPSNHRYRKRSVRGALEEAFGGTLYLDEISHMDIGVQERFLQFLETRSFSRIHEKNSRKAHLRIIVSTTEDLEQKVNQGRFVPDLYRRIQVVPIVIPSLRDRLEDLPVLIQAALRKWNQEYGRNFTGVDQLLMERMNQYYWPGNVRELDNLIARAMIRAPAESQTLSLEHCDLLTSQRDRSKDFAFDDMHGDLRSLMAQAEKRIIEQTLLKHHNRRVDTARALGISRRSLFYKLKEYGIQREEEA